VTLLDTSVLVEVFRPSSVASAQLRAAVRDGERLAVCTPVLYEWLRGPRRPEEIAAQDAILPSADAWPFGPAEAILAAELYRRVRSPRQREIDLAIAACALVRSARLWTLNPADFGDIPGLTLYEPPAS
jgi:predicted nucleic acid-binding protein